MTLGLTGLWLSSSPCDPRYLWGHWGQSGSLGGVHGIGHSGDTSNTKETPGTQRSLSKDGISDRDMRDARCRDKMGTASLVDRLGIRVSSDTSDTTVMHCWGWQRA